MPLFVCVSFCTVQNQAKSSEVMRVLMGRLPADSLQKFWGAFESCSRQSRRKSRHGYKKPDNELCIIRTTKRTKRARTWETNCSSGFLSLSSSSGGPCGVQRSFLYFCGAPSERITKLITEIRLTFPSVSLTNC